MPPYVLEEQPLLQLEVVIVHVVVGVDMDADLGIIVHVDAEKILLPSPI